MDLQTRAACAARSATNSAASSGKTRFRSFGVARASLNSVISPSETTISNAPAKPASNNLCRRTRPGDEGGDQDVRIEDGAH